MSGFIHVLLGIVLMAYLGPAIAIAMHLILREGYLSADRQYSARERVEGVLVSVGTGVLWLPSLIALFVQAILGR
ncbi:MAG: hypothetical protein Q8Q09_17900 [Deltaproteobacteria bacterium]|nr:hypothetical protein [Deltaproteobacteria bacterium]